MNQKQVKTIITSLKARGIAFEGGLTDKEIEDIKHVFEITFPEDLKQFLQTELPISEGFVNWRKGLNNEKKKLEIINRLNWPLNGILFDIKNNAFWLDSWGIRPSDNKNQAKIVTAQIAKQPRLIPIYSHRYISSEPNEIGNPVFSVYQTDIIYYGFDLLDYFSREFKIEHLKLSEKIESPKRIPFWSNLIDINE